MLSFLLLLLLFVLWVFLLLFYCCCVCVWGGGGGGAKLLGQSSWIEIHAASAAHLLPRSALSYHHTLLNISGNIRAELF